MRILAIRFGALGDVLRTLPAVRLVRRGLPGSRIAWAVDDRWAAVLQGHPDIDEVIEFPRAEWKRTRRRALLDWRRRLRDLAADLVLDFHGNLRSGLSGWLSGAPVRVGYAGHQQKEGNRCFTTHRVPAGDRRSSRIERNLALVRALGLPDSPLPDGGLPLTEPTRERAARERTALLGGADRAYAVVAPGVSRRQAYKRPPTSLLLAAISAAAARGVRSIVAWGPGEEEDARNVAREAGGNATLAPPTDLDLLAALLEEARMLVSGDTGPLHLACAVGCPVLALYGPTDPAVNSPWGVPFETLAPPGNTYTGIKRRDRVQGFDGLTEEMVRAAADRLLSRAGSPERV